MPWDNGTGRLRPFIGLSGDVMIDRNGRRDSYERVKGEIFRSFSDGRMRRRFTRTFSLIKTRGVCVSVEVHSNQILNGLAKAVVAEIFSLCC